MDNFYFCDPEKNTECTKEVCYINGGQCKLTSKEACKKTATNQDELAEIVRTMDPEKLANILEPRFSCSINCPCEEYCRKDLDASCHDILVKWLKEDK